VPERYDEVAMKVVVTGATGFIGRPLVEKLRGRGDDVTALVRNATKARTQLAAGTRIVEADLESPGPWTVELAGAGAVAHLAGEPIAGRRWDARQKQLIRDSRVESTRVLVEAIGKLPPPQRPKAFVCASGVDYYPFAEGPRGYDDDEVTESDPPADTFLGRVCRDWETEARDAEQHGVRVVCLRTALVFGPHGGALEQLARPFKFFAGGKLGNGRQWVSWIALDDVVNIYATALSDDRYRGPINMVTESVRNADLAAALGRSLHRPSWLPVPGLAIKAAVGSELAESLLKGRRVVPTKLRELGYTWVHPTLDDTLKSARTT
jgi:uncharacterized protein (TIGR01777 family)